MDPSLSTELVALLEHLLPGFIAAWVFHGLTAHVRPKPFDQVVQALIFATLIKAILVLIREFVFLVGGIFTFGNWSQDVSLVWSVILALLMGVFIARASNKNIVHGWLYKWPMYDALREKIGGKWLPEWGWTRRTSAPSQWFRALSEKGCWMILHLTGSRRLHGWAEEWPDYPDVGQFVMIEVKWLLNDGSQAPLYNVERIIVKASDVEFIELLKARDMEQLRLDEGEGAASQAEIDKVEKRLITTYTHTKGNKDEQR